MEREGWTKGDDGEKGRAFSGRRRYSWEDNVALCIIWSLSL